jgi:Domain of unknown function (DUF4440)
MRARLAFILVFSLMVAGALSAQQPKSPATVPPGVPAPGVAEAATIAEVMAFEKQCDDAAVSGDVAFLKRALSHDFVMTHGDGWTTGGAPLKVDTKETWIAYVGKQPAPYVYRRLDSIQVELHGDMALTIGRYRYLPRTNSTAATTSHLYVWFERAYARHNGEWQFLSHRTVKGPVREDDEPKSSSTK